MIVCVISTEIEKKYTTFNLCFSIISLVKKFVLNFSIKTGNDGGLFYIYLLFKKKLFSVTKGGSMEKSIIHSDVKRGSFWNHPLYGIKK